MKCVPITTIAMKWKWLAAGVFSLLLILIVPITLVSAWSGSASISPYTVYRGEPTSFTVTVNVNDSRSTDVSWVWVHFGWQASGVGYYFKANDGTKVSISGYGSRDFGPLQITVPQSALGQYSVEIQVRAQATGDWWAETKTSTDYVNVATIPTLQVSATGNPNSGTAPLTVYLSATVNGGLSPRTYSWSFGDGYTSSQQSPSHTYSSAGSYTAQLTVTDGASSANRQIVSDSVTINVSAPTGTDTGTGTGTPRAEPPLAIVAVVLIVVVGGVAGMLALKVFRKSEPEIYIPKPSKLVPIKTVKPAKSKVKSKPSKPMPVKPVGLSCPHCKLKLPADAAFCPECGRKIRS